MMHLGVETFKGPDRKQSMDLKCQVANAVEGWPARPDANADEIHHRLVIVEMANGYLFGRVRFAPTLVPGNSSLNLP
jgi:hypothetical protein